MQDIRPIRIVVHAASSTQMMNLNELSWLEYLGKRFLFRILACSQKSKNGWNHMFKV